MQGLVGGLKNRRRYVTLSVLFLATAVSFADRSMLSITGSAMSKGLHLSPVALGYLFSAFGWAYAIGQVPGGWLVDCLGPRRVYICSVLLWSAFIFLQGFVAWLRVPSAAIFALFSLLFLMGLCEAPVFPANSRIVAAWFPAAERGTAAAVFNSSQYFAAAMFAPIIGWITHALGWRYAPWFMGTMGFATAAVCIRSIYSPKEHPRIEAAELKYIDKGGALADTDRASQRDAAAGCQLAMLKRLLGNRMLLGVYLGTYCVTAVMYFFFTWFPIYLQARGMSLLKAGVVTALPALCGFLGGISGGTASDWLLRKGCSLTFARKAPIMGGMLLVLGIVACNYVASQWAIVLIMAVAYFGKGFGALGWAVIADTAPRQAAGLTAGVFNTFANLAAVTTPVVIGYLVAATGSFNRALIFLGAHAVAAMLSYLLIVGEIHRLDFE
jgi:ACS family glucarate transporter-like MFS transporter